MTLVEAYNSYPRNFALSLEDLREARFSDFQQSVTFAMKNDQNYSYTIRAREDFQKLLETFANYR